MLDKATESRLEKTIIYGLGAVTCAITPWLNLDPINVSKLFALSVFGFFGLFLLGGAFSLALFREHGKAFSLSLLFALIAIFGTWFHGWNSEQIFGVFGRNTGLLAYLCLLFFLVVSFVVASRSFSRKILLVLVAVGAINALYGLIQWRGLDPVAWANPYNSILGTLGNPNFTSALLGMGSLASLAYLFESKENAFRALFLLLTGLQLFISYQSDAIQGIGVFLVGAPFLIYKRFFAKKNWYLRMAFCLFVSFNGLLGVLGVLQRGPLSPILYQESVTFRGDYWRAGFKITLENPIFGVGLDSFGFWYREFRSADAAQRGATDVFSNSAHNVFLDISSGGGIPLLITYLSLICLAGLSSIRILRSKKPFDPVGVGLISCWIGYLAQSLISINQLGVAVWGWVLTGAIIGYGSRTEFDEKNSTDRKKGMIPARLVIAGFLGISIGLACGSGPIIKDARYRSALESADPSVTDGVARSWPLTTYYLDAASSALLSSGISGPALDLAKLSTTINPRNFNGWKLIRDNSSAKQAERANALDRMKALDPLNREFR